MGELSGIKGQFKFNLVPEINLRYNKGRRVLGNVKSSSEVAKFIRLQYKRGTIEAQEFFNVIYLNRRNSIIGYYRHSKGGLVGTIADPRLIFAIALKSLATGIIIAHNHPSGNLKPSASDINLTKRIKRIGELHDVLLLDHIIISRQGYFSFSDEGML
ncbi:JAB domain-containing protein [Aquimarina sp. U1-2]|uniref:JAB domain-containing protein n=1 Tax=Aquimarina sp. U1-2 TaxID=2823141 RepID=UPI001AEC94C5|nr:JAB domain-containing protein [Aquimarina sp. U1-2]MBP2831281.1 JAB domain-containing protein [Aquimarina sp. U1-2]